MPAVTRQPQNQQVTVGTAVSFSIAVSGSDPKQYQWLRDGQDIVGAVADSYTIPSLQLTDHNARFSVRITNAAGSVISEVATLSVDAVRPPGSLSLLAGGPDVRSPTGISIEMDGIGDRARFGGIRGVAADGDGNVFVASNQVVRKVRPDGLVTTLAGRNRIELTQALDARGPLARFRSLRGITVDAAGQVWVSDEGGIRRIAQDGEVTTVHRVQDAPASGAPTLKAPGALAADASGSLYVVDTDAGASLQIRKIAPDGTVRNVPGGELSTGLAGADRLQVGGIALDAQGNIYLTMSRVRDIDCSTIGCTLQYLSGYVMRIAPDGTRSVVAGTPDAPVGAQDGPAADARFHAPLWIVSTPGGTLYIADAVNNTIREVTASGVRTVVGVLPAVGGAAPAGLVQGALPGRLPSPMFITLNSQGRLFIAAGDAPPYSIDTWATTVLTVDHLP